MKKVGYKVLMTKFICDYPDGSATYEITFNKSLEHTGRFDGIERGLDSYVKREKIENIVNLSKVGLFIYWIKERMKP
jgi:hypothetical protein